MIIYRKMLPTDIQKVTLIENENFSIPWSEKAFKESLSSENTLYVVAEEDGQIYGYCGMYISFEVGDISNVAVGKTYQRKHIATEMLTKLLEYAKKQNVTDVTLEVRESNVAAIRLYERLGFVFVEEGIRKDFYEKPKENALIMWKHNI